MQELARLDDTSMDPQPGTFVLDLSRAQDKAKNLRAHVSANLRWYLAPWRAISVVAVEPAAALPRSAPDGFLWRARRNGTVNVRPTDLDRLVIDPSAPAVAPIGFAPYACSVQ